MEKCIPYEKLSKKEKRKMDRARRQTWGELNPVTRKPLNSKAYNRKSRRIGNGNYRRHNLATFLFCIRAIRPDTPHGGCRYPGRHRKAAARMGLGHHIDDLVSLLFSNGTHQYQRTVQMLTALKRQMDTPLL